MSDKADKIIKQIEALRKTSETLIAESKRLREVAKTLAKELKDGEKKKPRTDR